MYTLLKQINSPEDLKKLNTNQIKILAGEIRHFLVNSVSKTGGHLASNLGIVELTLALHKVYNSPKDQIIWDVGHQSYVHKILTGRREQFHTLRQYKGLSGFPKKYESIYDSFDTGHSSTSISAALGMAAARDLSNEKYFVIAVIGDGALTGGMAFEALNHAGQCKKNIIVVLNDNEMSISPNVGGLSNYLSKIRTAPVYSKVKGDFENIINKIPAIGKSMMKTAEKAKDCIKYFFVPGVLFEELGFTYIGPVNGHNYAELLDAFKSGKNIKGPVLYHVLTVKGKGYYHAENSPDKFHGIGPFEVETGKTCPTDSRSYSQIAGDTLVECAREDEKIIAITAAMPEGTGLTSFARNFPRRFFDVGIAEQHAVTFAAGIASKGYKPCFAVYSTFLKRGYDQLVHDVCLQNFHVLFLIDRAGLVGNDGETHHGAFDISYLSLVPNLIFLSPKDGNELREMIKYALKLNSPVAIRYPRGCSTDIFGKTEPVVTGKGEILYQNGNDALIIAVGHMNLTALNICEKLKEQNISAALINPRFIKPLDKDLILGLVKEYKKIYTIEDNCKTGGFGSQIQSLLNDHKIFKEVEIFALPDKFIEHGDISCLYDCCGLDTDTIFKKIYSDFQASSSVKEEVF